MRRHLVTASLALALVVPSLAQARTYCEERSHDHKLVGTALGALGGALLGSAVSPHHGGALIGGIGGAVVGNQLARSKCIRRSSASYRRVEPANYARAGGVDRCRYEDRPFYNARGELIYQPTRVCSR